MVIQVIKQRWYVAGIIKKQIHQREDIRKLC